MQPVLEGGSQRERLVAMATGPEKVAGETKKHQSDGDEKIRELMRVYNRGVDRVADDRGGGQDED